MGPSPPTPGVRTTCPYCGVGCGVRVRASEPCSVEVSGDAAHPANAGLLCSKGTALGATLGHKERLLRPMVDGARVSWDAALSAVGRRFADTIREHGPDSVAFYVSGQLLTEDYYAANKLMKGYIGSANIDTNSRLCMSSAVAAHQAAFGADIVPAVYEDLELADLLVLAGHNAAWTHPVLFRRIEASARQGRRTVCIDPRRTDTAEVCDLHLPIRPQTDVRLWNGLAAHLLERGAVDEAFIAGHVGGVADLIQALEADDQSMAAVAADCDVALTDLRAFYGWFTQTPRTVTLFSQGVNQSAQGVGKGLAIINAHLLTGRIGKPGAAPFSITGQPNAMGGREVGGLATALTAHMGFSEGETDRVRRYWGSPAIARRPGLKAVDMFEAVERGEIKALWIMATNPAVSLPNSAQARRALAACDFVVLSDVSAATDTAQYADVLLPARAWGEKNGTVTNSERVISRQRAFMPAAGEARADWRIVAGVAAAMGWGEAFAWREPSDVFREWAGLTAFENDGARPLNLGGLADLTDAQYAAMAPVRWPVRRGGGGRPVSSGRLFADGRFATPDGKARLAATPSAPAGQAISDDYPLALVTARARDHWHTMTRTGLAPELCRHAPEPVLEIHPDDAAALGVEAGALAAVATPYGEGVFPAEITARARRGAVCAPMHWTDAYAPWGRANALVNPDRDPVSGQPAFKHTPARVRPWGETWRGFAVCRRDRRDWPAGVVWRRTPFDGAQVFELAGRGGADERAAAVAAAFESLDGADIGFSDAARGLARRARLDGEALQAVAYLAPAGGRLPPRAWIAERFSDPALSVEDRAAILLGRAPGVEDQGPLICACMGVGARRIEDAIAAGAETVEAVGQATLAGTNCGSCRTELARMIAEAGRIHHAA